ncbi:MAG: TetR family transcriptional regulator [Lachnospiraceae bacterium]|nr:TetR family transcriptional regulator [Lachnospiraceae bacterium]
MSTKEKILDAALTLFAENGYDGTSVEQIARSDRQPQCEEECMEYIEKHLQHFCKVYMGED